jgi:hypothetical protein
VIASTGPGCEHECCAFESLCLVVQADLELFDTQVDRLARHDMGRALAAALGLGPGAGRLIEVALHSPDLRVRIAAADLLVAVLGQQLEAA